MKLLLLDHYYDEFARDWYSSHPGLADSSHDSQRESFARSMFGGTAFEIAALRQMGVDAHLAITNTHPSQEAWARENGVRLHGTRRWHARLRRGLIPWVGRVADQRWINEAILAQARTLRPDVIHVQCMDSIDLALLPELRTLTRLLVGQIAAPLALERATAGYQLIVSSLPNYVDRFKRAGIDAEWLPLAFEPAIADAVKPAARDVNVSFVGSLMTAHSERVQILEAVAGRTRLDIWTADSANLEAGSRLKRNVHPAAWGRAMYEVLGSSRITLNVHIDVAEQYANNLRLYEATGMGALLITDEKVNLGELFEIDREVVTYRTAQECAEKVSFYASNPDRAREIAEAGRRRTLRDHTWLDRMQRLVGFVQRRL